MADRKDWAALHRPAAPPAPFVRSQLTAPAGCHSFNLINGSDFSFFGFTTTSTGCAGTG